MPSAEDTQHTDDVRARIERALGLRAFTVVFQPIFDLRTGALSGVEALSRFHEDLQRPPDEWFREAHDVGRGVELEVAAIEVALRALPQLPPGAFLAVNASAATLATAELAGIVTGHRRRLLIELTGAEPDELRLLRGTGRCAAGVRLAVEEPAAGIAGLGRLGETAPEFVKLDRSVVAGIDTDPARRELAGALMTFAAATGTAVVAVGVETRAELDVVQSLGMQFAQGFFLQRPVPLAAIVDTIELRPPPLRTWGPSPAAVHA